MRRVLLPILLLLMACNAILVWRLSRPDLDLALFGPRLRYEYALRLEVDLVGDPAQARIFLPADLPGQRVTREWVETSGLGYQLGSEDGERAAHFRADGLRGHHDATYRAIVEMEPTRYEIAPGTRLPAHLPSAVQAQLGAEALIQVDHPEIEAAAAEACAGAEPGDVAAVVAACFARVGDGVANSDYENALDALSTLRWGEAFCGGKSRLLVALLRNRGVPARLVGGVILQPGTKRVGHVWCEVWVNGLWLPLDPVNGHYLERPARFLALYRGDRGLTERSQDMNFRYAFTIRRFETTPEEAMAPGVQGAAPYPLWQALRATRVPLSLLRILLLLPIAVLVVVVARNVLGIPSFGTFVPALLAMAFSATGLAWGLALLGAVVGIGIAARAAIEHLQLLHVPRMALVLSVVVAALLGISVAAAGQGWIEPGALALYPMIILVCVVEQCFVTYQESGPARTVGAAVGTVAVVAAVHLVIGWPPLEALVLVMPEILLAVGALYLALGRYVGLRASELLRFRAVAAARAAA